MATISINIPDEHMPRVINALCKVGGWRSVELDGAKGAYAKKMVVDYVRETVKGVEQQTAIEVAMATVEDVTAINVT